MAKDTFLNGKFRLQSKGKMIDPSKPLVMAILNLTPDSFYAKSRVSGIDDALKSTEEFINAGAKIIDIGAYSSRPNAEHISIKEELNRLIPIVEAIHQNFPGAILSIDTFRAKVAEEAINAGGNMVNDIAAGNLDEQMFETVAKLNVPYVMMHMKGTPQNMQQNPFYDDVTADVITYFEEKLSELKKIGIKDIIIDPGFGFSKTVAHNYQLLNNLEQLIQVGYPVLVGFSRKSMITKALGIKAVDALNGTTILNTLALTKGAKILRVHDVKEAVECVELFEQMTHQVIEDK